MSALSFVIPTRGRARQLSAAVRSIAEQIGNADVSVVVLYNKGELDTERAISRASATWKQVVSVGVDGSPDYSDKFRSMMRVAADSEWVWTFGDDDKLAPGALQFMLKRLETADESLSFIHVSEKKRSTGTGSVFNGRLIDLCCSIGWLEMTGFITGNITRGRLLSECAETPNWETYAQCSYAHSCAILETLKSRRAQMIDLPLVDSQESGQSPQIAEQWAKDRTGERYLYIDKALQLMIDKAILPAKLPPKFFRYVYYHLWDRHISLFISGIINGGIWAPDPWSEHVKNLAVMVDDEAISAEICRDVDDVVRLAKDREDAKQRFTLSSDHMNVMYNRRNAALYPMQYDDEKKKWAA